MLAFVGDVLEDGGEEVEGLEDLEVPLDAWEEIRTVGRWESLGVVLLGAIDDLAVGSNADKAGEQAWLAMGGANAYDEMALDPEDFDVIFAYPWPDEERVIAEMFDRHAAVGAVLLTYHGLEGMRLRRKLLDGAARRN